MLIIIAPLKGHLKVNVHDEAYARVHLGMIGKNFDFFLARLCFKGRTEYNLNILQVFFLLNKRWQSRMDNLETLATLVD